LLGLPIGVVFPPVPPADYLASVLADVLSDEFGLVAESEVPVYVTLNACRTLAYLQTRAVLSKDEGGRWALATLPAEYRPTLQAALEAYRFAVDDRQVPRESFARLVQFLRNAIEQSIAVRQP
jgi:streptomycin 3"-adenylyltransferase